MDYHWQNFLSSGILRTVYLTPIVGVPVILYLITAVSIVGIGAEDAAAIAVGILGTLLTPLFYLLVQRQCEKINGPSNL